MHVSHVQSFCTYKLINYHIGQHSMTWVSLMSLINEQYKIAAVSYSQKLETYWLMHAKRQVTYGKIIEFWNTEDG